VAISKGGRARARMLQMAPSLSASGYNLTLASDFGFRRRLARANLGDAQSHQD
jgi:hypothetical protein